MSVGITCSSRVVAGVNRLMQNRRSRKMVAMSVLASRLVKSLFVTSSSPNFCSNWLLTVASSSLSDWSSSFDVSNSSLVDCSSSLIGYDFFVGGLELLVAGFQFLDRALQFAARDDAVRLPIDG